MPSENFEYLLGKYGPLAQAQPLPPATIAALGGRLPPEFVDFLAEAGIGVWLEGRFQFCDPLRFQPVIDTVLEGDAELAPHRTTLFGFSAFGHAMAWNLDHGSLEIDLPRLKATCAFDKDVAMNDRIFLAPLTRLGKFNYGDWYEDEVPNAPLMFKRVRKAHGALALGEVYGFVPALALGGAAHVETAKRMKALEHFAILAQAGKVGLYEYPDGDERFVRELGTLA
jgi:hypothetical protein